MQQSPGARRRFYSIVTAVIGSACVPSGSSTDPSLQQAAVSTPGFERALSIKNDVSPALRDIRPGPADLIQDYEVPELGFDDEAMFQVNNDPVVQRWNGRGRNMPDPDLTFEGVSNADNFRIRGAHPTPPDPNGDIGPDHYMQTVNTLLAVFDRSGNPLLKDFLPVNALWIGFGGECELRNSGDPIILYDLLSDRWFVSQFAGSTSPFHQCIAISVTGDPTGQWHRYDFIVSTSSFNDYPKFGVWADGYYMSAGARGSRGQVWAFEREKMLMGLPAQMITFFPPSRLGYLGIMPVDLDGPPPPAGAPSYFVGVKQGAPQAIYLFQFHVDWDIPENSTFGIDGEPNTTLSEVAPFTVICPGTRSCIPQPDTSVRIDALAGRLVLYRAQYRNFGDHESIVFNHTVDAGGQRAGVRWYEIRDPGSKPLLYQQGTYAPDDGLHRWMASAAMDGIGNFAVGYSVASEAIYPSIYYAGRLATDPVGELSQGEALLQLGSGSQTSSGNRWGDYSMLGVDPIDDCTFWYTSEYVEVTATSDWQTRVGNFKFAECAPSPAGSLEGTVTDADTGAPIEGATVRMGAYSRRTDQSGRYAIPRLPVGAYRLAAYSEGYQPLKGTALAIAAGDSATANFSMNHSQ